MTRLLRYYFIALLIFMVSSPSFSQGKIWTTQFTGSGENRPYKSVVDASNNIYVVGTFSGTVNQGATILTALGTGYDIFVAKYNSSGSLSWLKKIGSRNSDDTGDGIAISNDNNYLYVSGSYSGDTCWFPDGTYYLKTSHTSVNYEAFVAKFSVTDGSILNKIRIYGDPCSTGPCPSQRTQDIQVDKNSNVVMVGFFSVNGQQIYFDATHTLTSNSVQNYFLVQYNQNLNFNWVKQYTGNNAQNKIFSLDVADDGYYISGVNKGTLSFDIKTLNSQSGSADMFLFKTDLSGNGQWIRSIKGSGEDVNLSLAYDGNGYVYISGYYASSDLKVDSTSTLTSVRTIPNHGSNDFIFAKYNSSGTLQWFDFAGGIGDDRLNRIFANRYNILITGYFSNTFTYKNNTLTSLGQSDAFGIANDANNKLLYIVQGGGKLADYGETGIIDHDGNYIFIGDFNSTKFYIGGDSLINSTTSTRDMFISKFALMSIQLFPTNSTCHGSNNGQVNLVVSGGIQPYTYHWSNGATTQNISGLDTGKYVVTVTDHGGTTIKDSVVLTEPASFPINLNSSDADNIICQGTSVTFTATSGLSNYNFVINNISAQNGPGNTFTTTSLVNHDTVKVIATDTSGCHETSSGIVTTVNPSPIPTISGPANICTNQTGAIYTTEIGMSSYLWNVTGGTIITGTGTDTITVTWGVAGAGHVTINYTNSNGCTATTATDLPVTINPLPVPTINGSAVVCANQSGVTYSTENGMTGYAWNVIGGTIASGAGTDTITVTWGVAGAGHVTVNYTNSNGCTAVTATNLDITINALPSFVTASNNSPVCVGDTLKLNSSPDLMVSYSWTGPNGFNSGIQNPTVSTNATAAMDGAYSVIVTNSNGCSNSAITNVTVNLLPVTTASNNGPVCSGATLNLTGGPDGMTSYSWSGPNGFASASQSPLVSANAALLMSGTYTLSVSNSNGCHNSATTNVIVNSLPVTTDTSNSPVCAGSSIKLTGGPGSMSSYAWTGPNGYNSSLQSPVITHSTMAMAGSYILTVTNSNHCSDTKSTEVTVIPFNPILHPTISSNSPVCSGDTLKLFGGPNGLVSYYWTGPNGLNINAQNLISDSATTAMSGTYSLWVTDDIGCSNTKSTSVVINASPITTAKNNGPICAGTSLKLTGGPGALPSYSWTGPDGYTSTSQSPTVSTNADTTMSGIYTLTATTSKGCSRSASTNVVVKSSPPNPTASNNSPICAGTTLSLTGGPDGIFSYSWTGPRSFRDSLQSPVVSTNATTTMSGNYILKVTSSSGCFKTVITIATVNALPVPTAINSGPKCAGDTIRLTGGPSGMKSYSWTGPNGFSSSQQSPLISDSATIAMSGVYTLIDTNTNGCSKSKTTTVTIYALPVTTATNNGPVCTGTTLKLTGGPGGTTSYSWTGPNGFTSNVQSPTVSTNATMAMAGIYTLTAANARGCTNSASTTVIVGISPPDPAASNNGPICAGTTLSLTGGPDSMTNYAWTGPLSFRSSLQSPVVSANATTGMSGNYTLKVTGPSGCSKSVITNVTVYALPVPTATNSGPVCVGYPIGLTGGQSGMISYSWTGPNGFTDTTQSPLISDSATTAMSGVYTLSVTNSNGCSKTKTTTVTINPLPVTTANNNGPVCTGNSLILTGGPSGMTSYSWTGPNGYTSSLRSPTVSINSDTSMHGTYILTATTSKGCSKSASTIVVVNFSPPNPTASNSSPICAGTTLSLTGGPDSMTSYAWTGPLSFKSSLQSPVVSVNATTGMSGNYTLKVTSSSGCSKTVITIATVNALPLPTAINSGPKCTGDTIRLTGGPSGMKSYSWTGPNGFSSSQQSPLISDSATIAMSGVYTLIDTNTNGCSKSKTTTVTIYALPVTTATNNGPMCTGTTLKLTGGPGGMTSYSWTGPNGFTSNAQSPTVSTNATMAMAGTYTLTASNSRGCTKSASTIVIVNPSPSTPTASNNGPVCAGTTLSLTGGPDGMSSYSWTGPNNYKSSLQSPVVSSHATSIMAGTYTLKVTNVNGCSNTATTVVTIYPIPIATNNGPVCVGSTLALSGGPDSMTTFSWTGPLSYRSSLQNPTVSASATTGMAGNYTLRVTDIRGCSNTVVTRVIVNILPVPTASYNAPVYEGGALDLFGNPNLMSLYSWTGPNGFTSSIQNPVVSNHADSATMSGIYILHVTDANNCSNSTTTSVIVHLLVGGSAPVIADNNNLNLQNNNIEMPSINSNNPEAQNNTVRLNIFPNPNKGKLNIDYYNSSTKKMTIEVFDILGIRICLKDYYLDVNNQCNTELDLTSMPKGLYLLRINNVLYKDRIIIQ